MNTPYYIFNKSTGKAIGPVMQPEPHQWQFHDRNPLMAETNRARFEAAKQHYSEYLSSLPEIEVHPDLKAVWEDQQKVVEDKDFELNFWTGSAWWPLKHLIDRKGKPGTKYRLHPLPSTKEEDQDGLWNEVVAKVATADIVKNVKPADDVKKLVDWKKEIIEKLKSKFTITRKQ